jgi:hypothetical protein
MYYLFLLAVTHSPNFVELMNSNYPKMQAGYFEMEVRDTNVYEGTYQGFSKYKIWFDQDQYHEIHIGKGTNSLEKKIVRENGAEIIIRNETMTVANLLPNGQLQGSYTSVYALKTENEKRHRTFNAASFSLQGRLYLNDAIDVKEIFTDSKVSSSEGIIEEKRVILLTSEGKYGKHTFSLDPSQGYLPIRIVEEKNKNSLTDMGEKVGSFEYSSDDTKQKAFARSIRTIYYAKRIELVFGVPVITSYSREEMTTYTNGKTTTANKDIRLFNFKSPEQWGAEPFKLSTKIPNGTEVFIDADKWIKYEWQDGNYVKRVNQPALANISKEKFVPAPQHRFPRWSLAVIICLISLSTIGLVQNLRRRRG